MGRSVGTSTVVTWPMATFTVVIQGCLPGAAAIDRVLAKVDGNG